MKDIAKGDIKGRELSYKASHDVLKAVGIMPTPIQSQVITNIYNDNRNLVLSPLAQDIVNNYFKGIKGGNENESEEDTS